jgi:glycosyltransferase involved in cell wall biosynthesis
VRSANIVVFELVRALAAQAVGRLGILIAWNAAAPRITEDERAALDLLRAAGVEVLPEIRVAQAARRGRLARWTKPRLQDLHPEAARAGDLAAALERFQPAVVLPIWTEWLTAALAGFGADKFAYYGNPDLKSVAVRSEFLRERGAISWAEHLLARRFVARLEPVHLATMRRYRWMGNVAANDADYYTRNGHPSAFYIQNTWFDRFGSAWRERREQLESPAGRKILGNVGKLSGTANTLGLHYLGTQVVPELERCLGGDFVIRICGADAAHPIVERALRHPRIEVPGFVQDIDAEILSSQVFLCVNNATSYKVGHTRYLHAWSLGACVVAHRDAALSMPEIVHGENALLGADAAEIAELIAQALGDRKLRRRLGEAGYETFRTRFSAEAVARRILDVTRQVLGA